MKKLLILVTILILIVFFGIILSKSKKTTSPKNENLMENTSNDNTEKSEESVLTPEQVLLEMDERDNPEVQGPLSAEIVSPVGDSFQMSQARMYKAEITNGINSLYKQTVCDWKFYLNEYDQEELYEEMEVPVNGDGWCGFTQTFINKRGKLRIVLEVTITDKKTQEVLDSFITEKNFLVE